MVKMSLPPFFCIAKRKFLFPLDKLKTVVYNVDTGTNVPEREGTVMRSRDPEKMQKVLAYINRRYLETGVAPSFQEIANAFGISKSSASRYVDYLQEEGYLRRNAEDGVLTREMQKMQRKVVRLPVIGTVACGAPMFAEQNIESYLQLSEDFLGKGEHFVLRAKGESMINAGICDGDYVVIRRQEYAEPGQIVVALIEDEVTLKRYYPEPEHQRIRLHPENDAMPDMLFSEVAVQGVAVKVIRDLL